MALEDFLGIFTDIRLWMQRVSLNRDFGAERQKILKKFCECMP
jgi:hypothetical protein